MAGADGGRVSGLQHFLGPADLFGHVGHVSLGLVQR
jgi:hypothetical protein